MSDTICIYCQLKIVDQGDALGWHHKRYYGPQRGNYRYVKRCQSKFFFWKNHVATPVPTSGLDQYYREVVWRANGRWTGVPLGPGALDIQPAVIYEDDYIPPDPPPSTMSTGFA